ncbi:ABC transporter permease [Yersinia aleksiciae]|uniref:Arginine ABC transporter permease protein ArtM n=1 Tax=Yersinia aleksiciae TaxID=263819 RepID=A0A0T9T7V0_YERAE|nr:ABC transporter permease subunit [Yersinia aleksiciae]MDA5498316.1 ABC transporter permease subunit [Yersinia aleksiciae]NIK99199.1 ABC transporter permease subunit [Yersinia aleksiciae]WQC72584.1 ABC transporter permease subunit [Yersinia aleksiciae]CFQ45604.1 Polar amino acid ABC transporter%2C inner membrane subunit [Yersinia aleksiciae]CNK66645.1 Polar amino acid ABC transporter%2C inner membrane subunit [Yersinia aleksiciae]
MNLQTILEAAPTFLYSDGSDTTGLAMTAKLFLLSVVPGMLLALLMAVGQAFGPRPLSWLIRSITYFFRSTPLYLQLMLIYYGLSQFDIVQLGWQDDQPFWLLFRDATFCAVLALVLNTSAYVAELLAGMMVTFPRQEWVAGEAFGMSQWQIIRRLVLPATLRRGIPALNNEMVFLLHATSLASTVTLLDITGVARAFYASTYSPFIPFLMAAALYLLCTFMLIFLFSRAERRWLAFARHD